MRKLSCVIITFLLIGSIAAQSPVPDKNKVMDFFQNMQYEEAISYLLTAEKMDSVNLQTLGYLGYAYQQNDDLNNASKYYQKMLALNPVMVRLTCIFPISIVMMSRQKPVNT